MNARPEALKSSRGSSATVVSGLQGNDVWELVAVDEQTRLDPSKLA